MEGLHRGGVVSEFLSFLAVGHSDFQTDVTTSQGALAPHSLERNCHPHARTCASGVHPSSITAFVMVTITDCGIAASHPPLQCEFHRSVQRK